MGFPTPPTSARRGRWPVAASGAADEVLAESLGLLLVVRQRLPAVEDGRLLDHPLEGELAHPLAVLDHERHVVGPDLEGRLRSEEAPLRVEAEAGVEEAGVVRA